MWKLLVVMMCVLVISGCDRLVHGNQFYSAELKCKDRGGIDYYDTHYNSAVCMHPKKED